MTVSRQWQWPVVVFTGLRSLAAADGAFEAGTDHCQGLCCSLVKAGCQFHRLHSLCLPLQGWDDLQQRMRPKRRAFTIVKVFGLS